MKEKKENKKPTKLENEIKNLLRDSRPVNSEDKLTFNQPFSFPKYLYKNDFKPKDYEKEREENNKENEFYNTLMNYPLENTFFNSFKESDLANKSSNISNSNSTNNDEEQKKEEKHIVYPKPKTFYKKQSFSKFFKYPSFYRDKYKTDVFAIKSHEYDKQIIIPEKDEELRDTRTTVMIKNIPNRITSKDLKEILDRYVFGKYNFFYLRFDFDNHCNVGYAFINFAKPIFVIDFYKKFQGYIWDRKLFKTTKIVELAYASFQGLEVLKQKFSGSVVMMAKPEFRPKMFHTEGPEKGYEKKFFSEDSQ
ncbi:mei2 [Ecytonucleospora hepatopenaei]|uniref:Mei2 n=1 Tax=Ecytonucleospora hepatopenaei TaxID=646526 RepID=A0A1W0E7F3_9MICR|nr:mei2 [Ecytonucleospora hepatopenaei]